MEGKLREPSGGGNSEETLNKKKVRRGGRENTKDSFFKHFKSSKAVTASSKGRKGEEFEGGL